MIITQSIRQIYKKHMKRLEFLPASNFVPSLHGIRGIAVSFVVLSHLGNSNLFLLPIPHDAIGKIGVWIFFSLSAFLLTDNLCREFDNTQSRTASILKYAIHRFFRIYPLYIFVLTGHIAFNDISKIDLLNHLLLVDGWGELWAIPVEFQYYLAIPIIAAASTKIPRRYVLFALTITLIGALVYGNLQPQSVFSNEIIIFPKIAPFILGSVLALSSRLTEPQKIHSAIPWICVFGLLATTLSYRYITRGQLSILFAPYLSIAAGASATSLIHIALKPNLISKLLGSRPLAYLGKISFSVYLLHMFAIRLVQKSAAIPLGIQAWLSLGLCIFFASITYRIIERPGIFIGKIITSPSRKNPA